MKNKTSIILKISSIIFFSLILLALVLIAKNPINGYEPSVYSALSPLIWALLIAAIAGGIGIVVYDVFREDKESRNWWEIGLSLILLSNLVIILLPFLRGYAFSDRGDHLSHIGIVENILQTGNFVPDDVYPLTHILISELSLSLNISPTVMANIIGPLFYLFFPIFTYFLAKELLSNQGAAILAALSSTVLFCYFYVEVFPMGFACITFPLILLIYFKSRRQNNVSLRFVAILLIVFMVFFHPVASFVLTLGLVVMEFSKPLLNKILGTGKVSRIPSSTFNRGISLYLPGISFVLFLLWMQNHYWVWEQSVRSASRWFQGELLKTSMLEQAAEAFDVLISRLNLQFLDLLEFSIRLYGHTFIYLMLSLLAVLMLLRNKPSLFLTERRSILSFSCFFLIIAFVQLVDYIRPLTILSSGRFIYILVAMFPPLVGLALYQISSPSYRGKKGVSNPVSRFQKGKFIKGIGVGSIITFCSLIGVFSIYPAPVTYQYNPEVTYMEVAQKSWFLNHADAEIKVTGIEDHVLYRFQDALVGMQEMPYPKWGGYLDDHFNYTQYQRLGESFVEDRYLLLDKRHKLIYTELWPQVGRFTEEDFAKLEDDSSADKLYTNPEEEVWYVRGSPAK